jgi:hypothetical protein
MRSLVAVLVLLIAVPALAYSTSEDTWNSPGYGWVEPVPGPVYQWERVVLFDNGPVWDQVYGTVYESVLQDVTLLMNTYGFGCQITSGIMVSDDFEVPVGETWQIQTITFFSYQSSAPINPSPFTTFYVQIWEGGPPDVGTLVWGDLATNRMTSSVFANVYRTLESTPHATNRAIFACTCAVPVVLGAGQYWIEWQAAGSASYSGPWAPPIVIWNEATTGDALQFYSGAWAYIVDSGSLTNQGLPFVIEGTQGSAVEAVTWGGIKALYR